MYSMVRICIFTRKRRIAKRGKKCCLAVYVDSNVGL